MFDTDVAIVGAGPYGLSAAAHLRHGNVDVHILGDPMSFWRAMPAGMLLRSNWTATCIAEYRGPLSLDSFQASTGAKFGRPVPLDRFIDYGTWVQQQVAPDLDRRNVRVLDAGRRGFALELEDGDTLRARRVVVAAGIAPFAYRPAVADCLTPDLSSHTSEHRDFREFRGKRVLVVGGGQSALESAALLRETGAIPQVAVRADHIDWLHGGKYHRLLGSWSGLVYAPTDVGPMGLSRVVAVPDLFHRLPRGLRDRMAYRSIRPAGAAWLLSRLRDVPIRLSQSIASATERSGQLEVRFENNGRLIVDHVLFGTGYKIDIARYPFLAPSLLAGISRVDGYPVLARGLESSVHGLHFIGAPAARSVGPTMRFVSGGWYAGRTLAGSVINDSQRARQTRPVRLAASAGDAR
jgi:FAD-dependent urate hydroxylase